MINMNQIYHTFEQYKDYKEFYDYCNEISENIRMLKTCPFDVISAKSQISKLTGKYMQDFNWIASLYNNGRAVTIQPLQKTDEEIWNDLKYINDHIPLIALRRKFGSEFIKQMLGL